MSTELTGRKAISTLPVPLTSMAATGTAVALQPLADTTTEAVPAAEDTRQKFGDMVRDLMKRRNKSRSLKGYRVLTTSQAEEVIMVLPKDQPMELLLVFREKEQRLARASLMRHSRDKASGLEVAELRRVTSIEVTKQFELIVGREFVKDGVFVGLGGDINCVELAKLYPRQ